MAVLGVLLAAVLPSCRQPARGADEASGPAVYGDRAGVAMGSAWLGASPEQQARDLDAIAGAGATWIRVAFPWSGMERRPGAVDWETHDRIASLAAARGLRIIANVAYTPAWVRPPLCLSSHCPPSDPAAFAAFVGAAVARYAPVGVRTWEIWNEPNIAEFWVPRPDPERYAELLHLSYRAAKAADPSVTVLNGGLAPAGRDGDQKLTPVTFLERLYSAGAGPSFDGVAVHPYTFPRAPTDPHPTNTFDNLADIRSVMVAHGDVAKHVWLTEMGFWTHDSPIAQAGGAVDEREQAAYLEEAYTALAGIDWAGPLVWFSYRDRHSGSLDREANFGLRRDDDRAKPAWRTFRSITSVPLPAWATWMDAPPPPAG